MALTIDTGSTTITFAVPTQGCWRTVGKYHLTEDLSEERYAYEFVTAPGVDGHIGKGHGFREQEIGPCFVMYVAASKANAIAAWQADHDAMRNKELEVSLPDHAAAFVGCFLRSFPCRKPKDRVVTFTLVTQLTFRKMRIE